MSRFCKLLFTVISISALLMQCKRDFDTPARPEDYHGTSYKEIFESFWNGVNNNYAMWAIDSTDWDKIYDQYKPLFDKLDIDSTAGRDSVANQYFEEMLNGFVDGHLWLERKYGNDSATFFYWPGAERLKKRPDYHEPIPLAHFQNTIPAQHLEPGYKSGYEKPTDPNSYDSTFVVSGTIKGTSILYLYFNSFQLDSYFNQTDSNQVKLALQHHIDQLNSHLNTADGLIIDVRGNGGGNSTDLNFLIGRLTKEKYIYGYAQYKNGNGRLDYGPWVPTYVSPISQSISFEKPIALICDIHSGSMTEITTLAVKAFPTGKGVVVGEQTFGRYSGIYDNITTGAGQFKFENGKSSLSMAYNMFKAFDGNIYEGKGTPPDVLVPYDSIALENGHDLQLDKAIEQVKQLN